MPDVSIIGGIQPRETLADLAIENINPGDTPILASVFPEKKVNMFNFRAPKSALGATLLVNADDTIGRDTKMIEEDMERSWYEGEIGMHGRQRSIPAVDIERAMEEQAIAKQQGDASDPLFDLESAHTVDMVAKNQLHREYLGALEMLDQDNYPASHKWGVAGGPVTTPIDVVNEPNIRELLFDMNNGINDDGINLPSNVTVIGVGARRGLEKNPAFLKLLPEDKIKRLRADDVVEILELDGSTIIFPNLRVQDTRGGQARPLLDNFIGMYRVAKAGERRTESWGRDFFKNDWRNGKRIYMNQLIAGVAETRVLGMVTRYIIKCMYPELGAMMVTVSNPIEEA